MDNINKKNSPMSELTTKIGVKELSTELLQHQLDAVRYFTEGREQFFNNQKGSWKLKGGAAWLLADGPRVLSHWRAQGRCLKLRVYARVYDMVSFPNHPT